MGALTETASAVTEFGGQIRCVVAKIDGAATGTVTVDEFGTVLGAFATLCEDSTVDC